jgi:hypothetical protein
MKVVFALQVVLMQCMWVDAVMYKEVDYTSTTCGAGTEKELEWKAAGLCMQADGGNYMKATCAANGVTFTVYSDAGCSTVNTTYTHPDPNIVVNNGVATLSGCRADGNEGEMLDCSGQPASVSLNVFTNAECTTASTDTPKYTKPLDVCEYETSGSDNSGNTPSGNMSSGNVSSGNMSSGNTSGTARRLLQALQTPFGRKLQTTVIVGEKTTWDSATNKATTTYYSDKACTSTATGTMEMDFGSDASTCVMLVTGMYMKFDKHESAAAAQSDAAGQQNKATASGCGRMQSLFLLPLLVFLGVPKIMML